MSDPAGVVDTKGGTASLEVPNRERTPSCAGSTVPPELPYPRLRVLEVLHCQGPAMMNDLAEDVGLSARNLTTLADGVEHEGLVRRVHHPADRRATRSSSPTRERPPPNAPWRHASPRSATSSTCSHPPNRPSSPVGCERWSTDILTEEP